MPDLASNSDSSSEGNDEECWEDCDSIAEWEDWSPSVKLRGPFREPADKNGVKSRPKKLKRGKKVKKKKGKCWKVFTGSGRRESKGDSDDEDPEFLDARDTFPQGDLPEGEHKDLWDNDLSGNESGNSTDSETRHARTRLY
jgi:hypothetical protein